jgi:hypothetical protein
MATFPHLDPALAINPSNEQVVRFMALDQSQPAVIVNLHEYWPEARYPADYDDPALPPGVSGREAYHRYLRGVLAQVFPHEPGAHIRVADCDMTIVGAGNWHEMVIGTYPTRAAMFRISAIPRYADFVVHRTAALKAVLTVALSSDPFSPATR